MGSNYPGNPAGVETPAVAPYGGIVPIVVVPADGDPGAAATFAQGYKVLADYVAYLMTRPEAYAFNIRDEFVGSGISSALWVTTLSGSGAMVTMADTTAGGLGVLQHVTTTAGLSSISTVALNAAGASGYNFTAQFRVRAATFTSGAYTVGFVGATGSSCYIQSTDAGNWTLNASSSADLGVAPSSSFQDIAITCLLVSGLPNITVTIGGSVVYGPTVNAVDLASAQFTSKYSSVSAAAASDIRVDSIALGIGVT